VNEDWTVVDVLAEDGGKRIEIAHAEGKVRVAVKGGGVVQASIVLDGGGRDAFMHAFAVAESQAEAFAIAAAEAVPGA
jgi:hypothetical protein